MLDKQDTCFLKELEVLQNDLEKYKLFGIVKLSYDNVCKSNSLLALVCDIQQLIGKNPQFTHPSAARGEGKAWKNSHELFGSSFGLF